VAGTANLTPRDVRRVANFQIRVKLIRASEAPKLPASQSPAQLSSKPASDAVVR
jgi:type IV pilus assembly protein PilN